jgi:hypothetical protein
MSKTQEQADIQRSEAKRLLNSAFGWGENVTSETVDRAIDCIISAAILEARLVITSTKGMLEQVAKNAANRTPSPSPHDTAMKGE